MALVMSRGSSWRKYWDETMAEESQFLKANPDYQVVVRQGHIVYGYGIPAALPDA